MNKNGWVLLMFALVAVMVGGYVAFSQPNRGNPIIPPKTAELKPDVNNKAQVKDINNGKESAQGNVKGNNLPNNNGPARTETPEAKKTTIPPLNPEAGEHFVEGEVKAVERERRIITIEQMMDDLSQQVNPDIPLADNAIIQTEQGDISIAQIKAGDLVGIILSRDGKARAVKVKQKE